MKIDISKLYLVSIFLIIAIGCNTPPVDQNRTKAFVRVQTATVNKGTIDQYRLFNGVTKYQRKEDIRANVTGYISTINFEVGNSIRRGQVLCYIRTKEQQALGAAIRIDSTLAKLTIPMAIKSEATGVVSVINYNENSFVSEGDIIATVIQPNSLTIQVSIPFDQSKEIIKEMPCEIVLKDTTINAKISQQLPIIDPLTQNQQFLIEMPKIILPENLKVQIRMLEKIAENAMVLPRSVIQTNELQTKFWVMKVLNDSLAVNINVIPLMQNDSLVQVRSTLLDYKDTIITKGAYQLQDSTVVRIENPAP
ncbi:efflux RND transporter periplasmic adaptor subunit [Galbibacter pacificus]|uniref:HlyD family efflux transporter periplasmic adaptor subunit n=1 Tax=Galbibacter pacificus TaxID=2996052 RepID=A0ABT6FWK0_9FLAO|nr:HlyD family efflux transporter periplasmic adaptor subunit [Galbibacter pacificus]MDG3583940.1 HlyD family efflux transporter periplasmic adaptor subunit [Galbibacter pacificus]MDG3587622.1 HlyD family efflux transporter periplasmic adaptor subunit [Galbibacter pacificus]